MTKGPTVARTLALLSFMFITGEGYHHDHPAFVVIGIIGVIVTLVLMVAHTEETP